MISQIGRNGIFLTILGQTCFISTYCFLIFVARLQRFDTAQEEAALDLGASQTQVFFKILVPYLMPAIGSSSVIAFLASFENYNTTVFSILSEQTLTTVIASKVRLGISPSISALALVIIVITLICAIIYEISRRIRKVSSNNSRQFKNSSHRDRSTQRMVPKYIFALFVIFFVGIIGWQKIVQSGNFGPSCIEKAEASKKSNFADQLKLLQNNASAINSDSGNTTNSGGTKEYNDIFKDPNLFKNFGGFDK